MRRQSTGKWLDLHGNHYDASTAGLFGQSLGTECSFGLFDSATGCRYPAHPLKRRRLSLVRDPNIQQIDSFAQLSSLSGNTL
jgi:hypothetical protein